MRANHVKRTLKEGKPSVGTWLSLGSVVAARFLARTFPWLTVDIEHTLVDWETATHLFGAIADAGCTPLARIPSCSHEHFKRALDLGAHGVVVPMVCTRAEAELAVAAMKYPPRGNRSTGGSVHCLNFDTSADDYFAHADEETLVILQCEHIRGVEDAESVYTVPGVDVVFVGPNDLAASMRTRDGTPPSPEESNRAHMHVLEVCKRRGIPAGIHCFSTNEVLRRIEEGWQFLAIDSELRMMLARANEIVKELGLTPAAKGEAKY